MLVVTMLVERYCKEVEGVVPRCKGSVVDHYKDLHQTIWANYPLEGE
jgi:hypothetical protein